MMAAATYDFEIEQGATLNKPFVWKDGTNAAVNLTGYAAKMQVRRSVASDELLMELSTANGGIVINGGEGKVTLTASAAQTSAIDWVKGMYAIELTSPSGVVTRFLTGEVSVSKELVR